MIRNLTRLRWLLGALLIAAAALLSVGAAREGDRHHDEIASVGSVQHDEATERSEGQRDVRAEAGRKDVFGVDPESTLFTALAVVLSVGVAAATWRSDSRSILLGAALFAGAFAVLDVVEVTRQTDEAATGVAVLAAVVLALHMAAASLAAQRRAAMP